ncbi:MAG: lactate utilization protein [Deltaproteobacteria bacterium]|jgi:L-lactate dehydrogenase complex protein LldG|nr:lactate utilization protein [Deltaproteobacteria bacterium]
MSDKKAPAHKVFGAQAVLASAEVHFLDNFEESLRFTLDLGERLTAERVTKGVLVTNETTPAATITLAAPSVDEKSWAYLLHGAAKTDLNLIRSDLRKYMSGIDLAYSVANLGVAVTGTCVMEGQKEDDRLATMICDSHVVAIAKSKIVYDSYEAEDYLTAALAKEPNYLAFISGPSRTADIERVLVFGAHGPLKLYVLIVDN